MKPIILMSSLLLLNTLVTEVQAKPCTAPLPPLATKVTGNALKTLLENHTVCVGSASPWQAQEYHQTPSGAADNLIDFKHGANSVNDPTAHDPTAPVGSWAISGNVVSYTYHNSGGTVYNDEVYNNGDTPTTYTFCDQNDNLTTSSKIISGQVGC